MTNHASAKSSTSPRQNDNTAKDDKKYNDTQQVDQHQTELSALTGGSDMASNPSNPPPAIITERNNKNFFKTYKNQIAIFFYMVLLIAFIVVAVKHGVSSILFFSIDF